MAAYQEQSEARAWRNTLFDLASLPDRFPKTERNATAQMLIDLTAADNHGFQFKGITREAWPGSWNYIETELNHQTDQLTPVPKAARAYLDQNAADLDKVYAQIGKAAPCWEMDLKQTAGQLKFDNFAPSF